MSHTYYKIWLHIVWSTKDRRPVLNDEIRSKIFNHIRAKAVLEGYHLHEINGTRDHVHSLLSLSPKNAISEVVNKLKGESSHWINSENLTDIHFAWQDGFSVFSVGESQISSVQKYIFGQEEHHRKISFTEELNKLLKLYNITLPSDKDKTA